MTFASWMVFVAALLPYVTTGIAKAGARFDNEMPRASMDAFEGWRRRADWAHRNHFEAFPFFAAAVILAEMAAVPQGRLDLLAGAFIVLRVIYTGMYLAGLGTLRSVVWALGLAATIWIFVLPALH